MTVPQDVLVVTAPGSGAEIIPFLKTWVNLPAAIGFTVLYAKVTMVASVLHSCSQWNAHELKVHLESSR